MNDEKYCELEDRSATAMLRKAKLVDVIKKREAHAHVQDVIAAMKEEGKALELTDEEIRMLRSFRQFKATIRKDGKIFTWQTRREDGIVAPPDPVLITDPQDVSA